MKNFFSKPTHDSPLEAGLNMEGSLTYEGLLDESHIHQHLPTELCELLRTASGTQLLNALALGALQPRCTEAFFIVYEHLTVELAARWLTLDVATNDILVLTAFSRILPFAPYLRPFASSYAHSRTGPISASKSSPDIAVLQLDNNTLRALLLAIFRLLSIDLDAFAASISPRQLQLLFGHDDRTIRYLAIRCFAFYMHAADAATEKLIQTKLGDDFIEGEWECITIDYRCLGLWEEQRWDRLATRFSSTNRGQLKVAAFQQTEGLRSYLSARTAEICGVLVPKLKDGPAQPSAIVKTPTTIGNLRKIANALLTSDPMLLVGLPNSGKTSLVNEVASCMGQAEAMITLHLNEQTDAKSLLGMYATSPVTGSFSWQPGVLTKAAREGRWVLIEDLNRAPPEVIGLILPIIERGELTVPSRREVIKCADGFRIIATMKSSLNITGEEVGPSVVMLGSRLWRRVQVDSLHTDEIRDVVTRKYPLLESRVPQLMNVYGKLCSSFHGSLAIKSSQGRTPGFRDLIKLCGRLNRRLQRLGAKTGYEPTPESTEDEIFLDVVDTFLKYLPDRHLQDSLAAVVGEALHISPQRAQFCLHERAPAFSDQVNAITIGRETCQKIRAPKGLISRRGSSVSRFASTRAALNIMEQVAAAVQLAEPVLLVGETGIGKTTVVQQLAALMRQKLTVVNLSQQSESTDLLGGFKPVNIRTMAVPLLDEFNQLFESTFSARKNQKFLSSVAKSVAAGNWARLVNLWHEAVRLANGVFNADLQNRMENDGQPAKKRKVDSPRFKQLQQRWEGFAAQFGDFEAQVAQGDAKFAFAFVQGKIVKALRNGEWVLLDEINLASPETLENIAGLLHHGSEGSPSVLLSEAGDVERIFGHPDFRIFGAMNPATDAGKRDLPPGLRSRFTEFYVPSPDTDMDDLLALIRTYLGNLTIGDVKAAPDLAQLYMDTKKLSYENKLTDGAGQRPHFSIRTLVRTLIYVIDHAHVYGLRRAIYEGYCMSFLTVLSQDSERQILPLLEKHMCGNTKNARSLLAQTPKPPNDGNDYVQFKHYWMRRGPFPAIEQPHYIITPFIEKNLKNLVRASSTRRFPVLLQGPTSAGKTSMIEYLAKISGNKFVRINNHEHTDLQEYIGSYVSADEGTLRYQEGIMVEALRNGYWIVLDELNLAPTDVLEALNRLLDDNRELFIPETQEVVHPHPNFMLFATQNPAGLYGGRKVLSRAFRNRFLELHFDDIPEGELEYILKERSQIAPSFCSRIVSVYRKLSLLRQSNRLFEQKNSFATLRDLFRWALRPADDREQLAINGFMLLGERVRNPQERAAVKGVIEEVMKVGIDEEAIYSAAQLQLRSQTQVQLPPSIVWTKAMRRLFILVSRAIENNEPVLLVGETGCGKTQLCQAVAEAYGKNLFIVNAHVNLETGDLIGAQRPIRNRTAIEKQLLGDLQAVSGETNGHKSLEELKSAFRALTPEQLASHDQALLSRIEQNIARSNALFEWSDGSLITAMKSGQFFLLDEISLADDSVLERLNSVLEPHRSVLLAEKGPIDSLVVAHQGFQFLSTMNPGGDYGKRELSAALRNRMTEIWAPQLSEDEDILPILMQRLSVDSEGLPKAMLQFAKWFKATFQNSSATSLSIRDLLAWVDFVNKCQTADLTFSVIHGAAMVFVDTLGANPAAILAIALHDLAASRQLCIDKLGELFQIDADAIYWQKSAVVMENSSLLIGPFRLQVSGDASPDSQFIMDAPTTIANSLRIARGLQSSKPILLEGSPGVGKTTLVTALATALGKPLTRINLSEQTDLTDLFGSDVPVEGGDVGQFTWRDAPFLQAMQRGHWVLLDEMNLASQSVLEGLNSCLDHRQQVYIAELDQTFKRHPDFVLFAAQNPHHQGGGRKGLPASFVNRFTVVYADSFTEVDLSKICERLFPGSPSEQTRNLVEFVSRLNSAVTKDRQIGALGGPWEVNLRDIQRWLQLADRQTLQIPTDRFLDVIISQRFRTQEDRLSVSALYQQVFGEASNKQKSLFHNLTPESLQIGLGMLKRDLLLQQCTESRLKFLPRDLSISESLIVCIDQAWPSILVGPAGCGKTTLIRKLAAASGARLIELVLSADTDTMDLIGGFEQMDHRRETVSLMEDATLFIRRQLILHLSHDSAPDSISGILEVLELLQDRDAPLVRVCSALSALARSGSQPELDELVSRANRLLALTSSVTATKVGFEWTEGILTQAVQLGYWVVLDNANLCNPSVLDRLNSLTEPNGSLILNEQRTQDGCARVIRPHPNFRLFLTMNPRNGELSRAMRNRCVEICFLPEDTVVSQPRNGPCYPGDSFLYRLRHVWTFNPGMEATHRIRESFEEVLKHLSKRDLAHLQRVSDTVFQGFSDPKTRLQLASALQRYVHMTQENVQSPLLGAITTRTDFSGITIDLRDGLQPVHLLVNEPILSIVVTAQQKTPLFILSSLAELRLDLYRLHQLLAQADESGKILRPSQMTLLERSLASNRIPSLRKDSTQPVGQFLIQCGQAIQQFILSLDAQALVVPNAVSVLRELMSFCWDVVTATEVRQVDEGEFQVLLQTGRRLCSSLDNTWTPLRPLISTFSQALTRFHDNWSLRTGLSMQRMWDTWRPTTPRTAEQLRQLIEMEAIVSGFADVALKTRLEISKLGTVYNSLVDAQQSLLRDGADGHVLIQSLKETVSELSTAVRHFDTTQAPFFSEDFETLCQYHDLLPSSTRASGSDSTMESVLGLLAGRPARPLNTGIDQSMVPDLLDRISLYAGSNSPSTFAAASRGRLSLSLIRKLNTLGNLKLGHMELLETEKQTLAKCLSSSSLEIAVNQAATIRQMLSSLAVELLVCHRELLDSGSLELAISALRAVNAEGSNNDLNSLRLALHKDLPKEHYFHDLAETSLAKLFSFLTADCKDLESETRAAGLAAVQIATILLRLFVPDRPFDPSLDVVVQRQRHNARVCELTVKSEAILSFEADFTGLSSNLRYRLLHEQLSGLGSAPPPPSVIRPRQSELGLLQAEFSNLIKSVLDRNPASIFASMDQSKEDSRDLRRLFRNNVRQLIERLSINYRSYGDITIPVVRFLQILDLGLALALTPTQRSIDDQTLRSISERTPLLGGKFHPASEQGIMGFPLRSIYSDDVRFHRLAALALAQNADASAISENVFRDELRRILEEFYQLWKTQLIEDQQEEARKSELYHYRGSWEDSEEVDAKELQQLFPTYDGDSDEDSREQSRSEPRVIAIRLASFQSSLFSAGDPENTLTDFVKTSARLLGSIWSDNGTAMAPAPPKAHLPGVLLLLEDAMQTEDQRTEKYNFYTDAKPSESRKLLSLVHSVLARFAQLQAAWPEHAVISDVIVCSKEILQFKHVEPVAKFLTKVEKLHGLIHEWQLVASKEYSATSLYDEVSNLIISWRRLELSTWAKLLDLEQAKCEEDASSWWFIAYEAIIEAPMQMLETQQQGMAHHVQEVVSTLEQFILSTTVGQFSRRLKLIANFRSLLLVYARDFPGLNLFASALSNFIQHYVPFEPAVRKLVLDKRSILEKDLKEQIRLASWRDTNIIALRESAKRSHHKLFKVVRKYREALAQPVSSLLLQGMPEITQADIDPMYHGDHSLALTAAPDALAICQSLSQVWNARVPRFKNPDNTAGNMTKLYEAIPAEFDVSEELELFMTSVIENIKDFKSQTPLSLTEENKGDVQHLKAQKRRFYADTLKQLMELGIKRNVGTSIVEKQASVSQVLSFTPALDADIVTSDMAQNADSYFHRFLDLVPRVRQASREYSEDLSNVEISRSVGSIEYLLFLTRKQRESILPAFSDLHSLKSTLTKMSNIWRSKPISKLGHQPPVSNAAHQLRRTVAWLIPILGLAAKIVGIHSKFSGTDSSSIDQGLQRHEQILLRLRQSLGSLPQVPSGVILQVHEDVLSEARSSLDQLSEDLRGWAINRPDLEFVLEQISNWTIIETGGPAHASDETIISAADFDAGLLAAVDKVLVALQNVANIPGSVEHTGLLARSDEFFARAVKGIRMPEIKGSLEAMLEQLQSVVSQPGADLSHVSALVATVLPITNTYYEICKSLLERSTCVHRECCKMSYVLAKSFTQIAAEGFCSPAESSTEESNSGKLESGTGLGEGEGAEDISKDVGDDEDLSELAQQEKTDDAKEDMDESADAVNMDQEDLQAEAQDRQPGDEEEQEEESAEEDNADIDEEVGSVNDLDPSAVDEKMWDGAHDEQQKETENEEGKGASEADQQTAAQQQEKGDEQGEKTEDHVDEDEEGDEEEEAPDEQGEAVGREEMDVTDPHTKEEEKLDLPEEMQLDGEEKEMDDGGSDAGMDDLSEMDPVADNDDGEALEDMKDEEMAEHTSEEAEPNEDAEEGSQADEPNDAQADDEEVPGDEEAQDAPEDAFLPQRDENDIAGDDAAPSDAVTGGLAAEQDLNDEKGASGDAHQESGSTELPTDAEQQTGAAKESDNNKSSRDAGGADDASPEDPQLQAFKKLGDILEKWHRRQKEILDASRQEKESEKLPQDTDMNDADFEHLADQDDVADTQALGQASEEQATALDQNMGVESDTKPADGDALPDASEDNGDLPNNEIDDKMQVDNARTADNQGAGAFIPAIDQHEDRSTDVKGHAAADEELDEVDTQLAAIHLSSSLPPLTPHEDARRLWLRYESATNDLSLSLTEQLRLILAPTQATKLRGDFRTGKRLNIKRIIPYIASQYKRDKIWMRRSIPSKRNYQIMLAVDDSKSMLESGSGQLAFETLALVAKSLSMLEAGDLCILGFGNEEHVRVAHEFGKPFSSEAGSQVFQHFSYQQTGTNVRKLIADSIALFREARFKRSPASGGAGADLWQLELIISDGICEDHETIRRLVRQAQEERIMIVFIIVDAVKGSSILDLTQASFEPDSASGTGEMKLKMKRYLEGFPFPYYLVVRDVRELPAVLATALKQWFAEVVDVSS